MVSIAPFPPELLYPSSDGKPMAENTEQYRWIALIKENLEVVLQNTESFIAADLLWYPEEVDEPPAPRQAPDVMVVLGLPRGRRESYKQWEEGNIPPQVVFEILSPSNKTAKGRREMESKFEFYERHGVEEYYLYDPDALYLKAWIRQNDRFVPVSNLRNWVSPRLKIRFKWIPGQEMKLYTPEGKPFQTLMDLQVEIERERLAKERERLEKEQERREKERERFAKERERQGKERERLAKEEALYQMEQERQAKERLIAYLRSQGIDPDQI